MFSSETSRREFLQFMGQSAMGIALSSSWLARAAGAFSLPFKGLRPSGEDRLLLADGFDYDLVLRWRDPLNAKGEKFGFNNDFIAFSPFGDSEGLMWVNHEYHDPFFNSGWREGGPRTREQMEIERREVGGSIAHLKKSGGKWALVKNSPYNRRLDATTPIPFAHNQPIFGARQAIGTLAGCGGGMTPWGTFLSCEENYHNFYGEAVFEKGVRKVVEEDPYLSWMKHFPMPPEHYGWVVEIEPKTGKAKKLVSMGRFSHEAAAVRTAADGRAVAYSGDDMADEHLYKFIASKPGSLEEGTLYVADIPAGKWRSLDRESDPRLKKEFKDQTELLTYARRAAKLVGATPLARPEDIEIEKKTGFVYVALTNNKTRGNHYGSILKIEEKDPLSLEFKSSVFLTGGDQSGVSCPDNLAFDRAGGLWVCTDMSGDAMGKGPYVNFANNSLFYIPMKGPGAGLPVRVASAPVGAEFTGPCFSPDGRTLFLSVQHPGEHSRDPGNYKSHWPDGGKSVPAPCVVAISGKALDKLIG